MWGKRANETSPARAALAAVAAGFLIWTACAEEETLERRSSWREVATFPYEAGHVRDGAVAADGAFYAAATYRKDSFSDPYGAVYRSDGGALEEVFRSPYAGTGLGAIGAGGGAVWAAGARKAGLDYRPYIVRLVEGRWEEVDVPPEVAGLAFNAVYAGGKDFCWFKSEEGIYTYDGGAWRAVLDLNDSYNGDDLFVTAAGRAFLVAPASKHNPPGATAIKLFVSDDRGATWREEKITSPDPARPFYSPAALLRAGGERIFAVTHLWLPRHLVNERRRYATVVFARDEAPGGRGSYNPVFEVERGGYFRDIDAMAFRAADEGYAVGPYTSVALARGEWHVEAWQKSFSPWLEGVAAGPSGYWAIGMPRYEGPRRLYRAPPLLFISNR
jgi:hypothetical protein